MLGFLVSACRSLTRLDACVFRVLLRGDAETRFKTSPQAHTSNFIPAPKAKTPKSPKP